MWRKGSCQTIEVVISNIFTRWLTKRWGEKRIGQWCGQWTSTDPVQCDGGSWRQCRSNRTERKFCQWRSGGCRKKWIGRLYDFMTEDNQQLTRDSWCNNEPARRADDFLQIEV
jgi:hypothetical protein